MPMLAIVATPASAVVEAVGEAAEASLLGEHGPVFALDSYDPAGTDERRRPAERLGLARDVFREIETVPQPEQRPEAAILDGRPEGAGGVAARTQAGSSGREADRR